MHKLLWCNTAAIVVEQASYFVSEKMHGVCAGVSVAGVCWSECCWCVMVFLQHVRDILWCNPAAILVEQASYLVT